MADVKEPNAVRSEPPSTAVDGSEVRPSSWADMGTWPASVKFLPVFIALVAVFIAIYYNKFMDTSLDLTSYGACVASFNYTFHINAALEHSHDWSKRSWEIGYAFEATQQVFNPERSVFSADPFPDGELPRLGLSLDHGTIYVRKRVECYTGKTLFDEMNGSVTDPTALGVAALMLSRKFAEGGCMEAALQQKNILLDEAPRTSSGAISHRFEETAVWSDAIAMFPPFLAYFAVATGDVDMAREAVRQIRLYRDELRIQSGRKAGLWKHVAGPAGSRDDGAWSTGNAWAAYGMARVRATISAWQTSRTAMAQEIANLDLWIQEILDGAIRTDDDDSGLLRNYLGDATWFGETSGTSLLAATAYRMSVINAVVFPYEKYLDWAERKRRAVFSRIDDDGISTPAVNPYEPQSKEPIHLSPEGESFLLLLGTAWRDCVCYGPCLTSYREEVDEKPFTPITFESITGYSIGELIEEVRARYRSWKR